jgi:hypothetical protein
MSRKISADTERAIQAVKGGMSRYAAAKKYKLALSTVYRAMPELNKAKNAQVPSL